MYTSIHNTLLTLPFDAASPSFLHVKARHVRQFSQNVVGRGYFMVVMASAWLLRGLRLALMPWSHAPLRKAALYEQRKTNLGSSP